MAGHLHGVGRSVNKPDLFSFYISGVDALQWLAERCRLTGKRKCTIAL